MDDGSGSVLRRSPCLRAHVRGIRLLYTLENGSEHLRDFASVSEARDAVTEEMTDWVVFELVEQGRYAVCGRVLDSSDEGVPNE